MIALVSIVFWTLFGYRYFVGGAGLDHVPIVKRWLDPGYMPRDYLLNYIFNDYNHREYFTKLVGVTAKYLGSVELSFIIFFVIFGIGTIWATTKLAEKWTNGLASLLFSVIGTIIFWYVVVRELSPGLITQVHGELTANMVAHSILLWAIYCSVSKQTKTALILVSLAALFQPIDALLTFPLVGLLVIVSTETQHTGELRKVLLTIVLFSILLVSVVSYTAFDTISDVWNEQRFFEFIEVRLPHHYLPSTWPHYRWTFLIVMAIAGTYALLSLEERNIAIACLLVLNCFIVYMLVTLTIPVMWLYKLQGAKLLWGNYVVWGIGIFTAIPRLIDTRTKNSSWMVIGVVFGSCFILVGTLYGLNQHSSVTYFTEWDKKVEFSARMLRRGNYRTAVDYASASDLELATLLMVNTDKSDLILHSPEKNIVRSIAERASVGLSTTAGFSSKSVVEYLERQKALEGYCDKTVAELNGIASKYKAQFIAVRNECSAAQELSQWDLGSKHWKLVRVRY